MKCVRVKCGQDTGVLCFLDSFRIRTTAGEFCFEYHQFTGPQIIDPPGEMPADELHPFWAALTLWIQHGRRVDNLGYCILEAAGPMEEKNGSR